MNYNEIRHSAPKTKVEREFLQGKIEVLEGQNEILEPRIPGMPKASLAFQNTTKTVANNKLAIERIQQLLG